VVGAHLTVDFDTTFHANLLTFLVGEGVFEAITEKDDKGETLPKFVSTRRGARGIDPRHFAQVPLVKVCDTVKVDIATGKMIEQFKFELGCMVMLTGGNNTGRVGSLMHVEKHEGSFAIVTIKDAKGNTFATRLGNVFVIGNAGKAQVNIPKGRGIKKTILEERTAAEARGDL